MERMAGSLLDVTVSDDGESPGRGEDFFILLIRFFKPQREDIIWCILLCRTVAREKSQPL
jgi:hypothetical protein